MTEERLSWWEVWVVVCGGGELTVRENWQRGEVKKKVTSKSRLHFCAKKP